MAQGKKTGGRVAGTPNKATAEIKVLAGAYSAETIEILIGIARSADSDAAKVAACRELLDRGHGKPTHSVSGDMLVTDDVAVLLRARQRLRELREGK